MVELDKDTYSSNLCGLAPGGRLLQCDPLVWSTDVRFFLLQGPFLAGPNHGIIISGSNPVVRSARLYGPFFCSQNIGMYFQAGCTVHTFPGTTIFDENAVNLSDPLPPSTMVSSWGH